MVVLGVIRLGKCFRGKHYVYVYHYIFSGLLTLNLFFKALQLHVHSVYVSVSLHKSKSYMNTRCRCWLTYLAVSSWQVGKLFKIGMLGERIAAIAAITRLIEAYLILLKLIRIQP